MSTENVTWAPHFCVLVLFWVPNILQCRESKLWGSTLTSKKEKKEHLGWKRWWFKLCLLFCISQSRIFIQCPILFWILLYPKNCPNRDAWDWVPSKNLWCSFENQAIIVMCTPAYSSQISVGLFIGLDGSFLEYSQHSHSCNVLNESTTSYHKLFSAPIVTFINIA